MNSQGATRFISVIALFVFTGAALIVLLVRTPHRTNSKEFQRAVYLHDKYEKPMYLLRVGIRAYIAKNHRFPDNLEELEREGYVEISPTAIPREAWAEYVYKKSGDSSDALKRKPMVYRLVPATEQVLGGGECVIVLFTDGFSEWYPKSRLAQILGDGADVEPRDIHH
jgi:hypothetical protein